MLIKFTSSCFLVVKYLEFSFLIEYNFLCSFPILIVTFQLQFIRPLCLCDVVLVFVPHCAYVKWFLIISFPLFLWGVVHYYSICLPSFRSIGAHLAQGWHFSKQHDGVRSARYGDARSAQGWLLLKRLDGERSVLVGAARSAPEW